LAHADRRLANARVSQERARIAPPLPRLFTWINALAQPRKSNASGSAMAGPAPEGQARLHLLVVPLAPDALRARQVLLGRLAPACMPRKAPRERKTKSLASGPNSPASKTYKAYAGRGPYQGHQGGRETRTVQPVRNGTTVVKVAAIAGQPPRRSASLSASPPADAPQRRSPGSATSRNRTSH